MPRKLSKEEEDEIRRLLIDHSVRETAKLKRRSPTTVMRIKNEPPSAEETKPEQKTRPIDVTSNIKTDSEKKISFPQNRNKKGNYITVEETSESEAQDEDTFRKECEYYNKIWANRLLGIPIDQQDRYFYYYPKEIDYRNQYYPEPRPVIPSKQINQETSEDKPKTTIDDLRAQLQEVENQKKKKEIEYLIKKAKRELKYERERRERKKKNEEELNRKSLSNKNNRSPDSQQINQIQKNHVKNQGQTFQKMKKQIVLKPVVTETADKTSLEPEEIEPEPQETNINPWIVTIFKAVVDSDIIYYTARAITELKLKNNKPINVRLREINNFRLREIKKGNKKAGSEDSC